MNPVSFELLSLHVRLICDDDALVAATFDGAVGTVVVGGGVVLVELDAEASFVYAEFPGKITDELTAARISYSVK